MPSEHNPSPSEQSQPEQPTSQVKLCSTCRSPLVDTHSSPVVLHEAICSVCQDPLSSARIGLRRTVNHELYVEVENELVRRAAPESNMEANGLYIQTRQINDGRPFHEAMDMEASPTSSSSSSPLSSPTTPTAPYIQYSSSTPSKYTPLTAITESESTDIIHLIHRTHTGESFNTHRRQDHPATTSPDPLVDITRLRVRSRGHHCLYPGASFQGTQKSGRNSYDVNVTIVDVDFSSSTLCGYLRIRDLTDEWPELTTYFDAEIIGSRYGFLTQNWEANEQEDMVHWQRFPAFRHVRHELKRPHLTMPDRDRGAVFMRWKERFLVPDHCVQDINGASFAGFYYVCVDFNPQPPARSPTPQMPLTPDNVDVDTTTAPTPVPSPAKAETAQLAHKEATTRKCARSPSIGPRNSAPTATMSGFYFHQNSEPYQQLSLSHVPERSTSTFEFR